MSQKTRFVQNLLLRGLFVLILVGYVLGAQTAPVKADTIIDGDIIGNATWIKAMSPYIVVKNITVHENVTLTIEPGVVVKFFPGAELKVFGTLVAQGQPTDQIIFTSYYTPSSNKDYASMWETIHFANDNIDYSKFTANGDFISGSMLEYCVIENARAGGRSDSKTMDGVVQGRGLYINNVQILNSGRALRLRNSYLKNSYIHDNNSVLNGGGVFAINSTLKDNTILRNTAPNGAGISGNSNFIKANIISQNVASGAGGGFASDYGVTNTDASFEDQILDNSIIGNKAASGGGIYVSNSSKGIRYLIKTNNILGNTADQGGAIYTDFVATGTNQTEIRGNYISANVANQIGAGILVHHNYEIYQNTIINNRSLTVSSATGGVDFMDDITENGGHMNANTIKDNQPYDVVNHAKIDVDAVNNFWDASASSDVKQRIYDYYDDTAPTMHDRLGKVEFIPFFSNPDPKSALAPVRGTSVQRAGDTATVTWDAVPSYTTGWWYRVYYVTNPSPPFTSYQNVFKPEENQSTKRISYTITGLDPAVTYYFFVTVLDNAGHESWYSSQLPVLDPELLPLLEKVGDNYLLTVYGSQFGQDTILSWEGVKLGTTLLDANTLQAVVPADLVLQSMGRIVNLSVNNTQQADGEGFIPDLGIPPMSFLVNLKHNYYLPFSFNQ
jgi:hypothetical protein